jgi:hypothetical protein
MFNFAKTNTAIVHGKCVVSCVRSGGRNINFYERKMAISEKP